MANVFSSPFLGGSDSSSLSAGTIGTGIGSAISTGSAIYGALAQSDASQSSYQASANIAGLQQQADQQRFKAMQLQASRQQMEVLRNNQRARSLALNNATSQGAQFGSGLQGGYGQISGMSGTNMLGINQNLEIGSSMFELNQQIDQQQINKAQAESQGASAGGLASLGKAVGGAIGPMASFAQTIAPMLLL